MVENQEQKDHTEGENIQIEGELLLELHNDDDNTKEVVDVMGLVVYKGDEVVGSVHAGRRGSRTSAEVGSLSRDELWKKLWDDARYDLATVFSIFAAVVFTLALYFMSRPRSIYLVDFACFKPSDDLKVTKEEFIEQARRSGKFDEGRGESQVPAKDLGVIWDRRRDLHPQSHNVCRELFHDEGRQRLQL
ncbi:hypothetical protein QQ045_007607 [Rhodiola kirilowii]